ncbi:MAG: dienelactone hydrolase family protein [bacterium]|nr:MAG: dienelactone hydrolase family protein [bacterium]
MRILRISILSFMICQSLFAFETITFPSRDSLLITADLYWAHDKKAPFILLFHQAGFSRGEYRDIAPILNELGFNVMAIDQRSGSEVNSVKNETARRALEKNLRDTYLDALPDLLASIDYAESNLAEGLLIIWGSSYSASLALKIAGDMPGQLDGVLAFSPGEYFERLGESSHLIQESAINIKIPVFITSAQTEKERWWSIYENIPFGRKVYFLPSKQGIHGSRALWTSTEGHEEYWSAVKIFLMQFLEK